MKRSIEWAAGLFEGEGCICISDRDEYKGKRYPKVTLRICMTDEDVIKDYADTLELKATGPYAPAENRKPTWAVATCKKSEVKRILSLLLPHLGSRRAYKALNALDVIECELRPENIDFSKL